MKQPVKQSGMTLKQDYSEELLLIEGYGDGGFRLKGRKFVGGLSVYADAFHPHDVANSDDLTVAALEVFSKSGDKPELILIGTGNSMKLLPSQFRKEAQAVGYAIEFMDTGAAARTYNVLLMEGRKVAAFLVAAE